MASFGHIKLGVVAITGLVFGVPPPARAAKPFVIPAWLPDARLIKLRFRPRELATAFLKVGNEVRQYAVANEYYYFTIDDRFELGRTRR